MNEYNLEELYKKINICTLLILKLFDKLICKHDCISTSNDKLRAKTPLHYIAYNYGLISCYLDEYNLVLLFKKSDTQINHCMIKSDYYTFIDRLIDCDYFHKIATNSEIDRLAVWLKIPRQYHRDIDKIKESKYSKVSKDFKEKMKINYTEHITKDRAIKIVPSFIKDELIRSIIINSIPYKIVSKNQKLKDAVTNTFNIPMHILTKDDEVYNSFNEEQNIWKEEYLKKKDD